MNTVESIYKSVDKNGRQVLKAILKAILKNKKCGIIAYPKNEPILRDDSNNIVCKIDVDSLDKAYLNYTN